LSEPPPGPRPAPAAPPPPATVPPRWTLRYRAVYRYDRPAPRASLRIRLSIPEIPGWQRVLRRDLRVRPAPARLGPGADALGNAVEDLEVAGPFDEIAIEMEALVETVNTNPFAFRLPGERGRLPLRLDADERAAVSRFDPRPGTVPAPVHTPAATPPSDPVLEFGRRFADEAKGDVFGLLAAMTRAIHREFRFSWGVTNVQTAPEQVLALRTGVCQDFTTLMIAAARRLGIPARYASGFVYDGPPERRRAGELGATHSWCEAYIPGIGWKGFDPTNGILVCHTHVFVAAGPDARSVTPVEGTTFGPGSNYCNVAVDVDPAEEDGRLPAQGP